MNPTTIELPAFQPFLDTIDESALPGENLPDLHLDDATGAEVCIPEAMRRYRLVAEEDYHQGPFLSSSGLKHNTPWQMLQYQLGSEDDSIDPDTGVVTSMSAAEDKAKGTLLHIAALDPHRFKTFDEWTLPCPTKTLTSQAAVRARMDNPGKMVLTEGLASFAYEALSALSCHPIAMQWIQEGYLREISGFFHLFGVRLRWRIDFCTVDGRILGDLKSTRRDLSSTDFGKFTWNRECWDMGYYAQAALYCYLHMMLTGIQPDEWRWVVVSKVPKCIHTRVFRMKYLVPGDPGYKDSIWATVNAMLGIVDRPGRIQQFVESAAATAVWQNRHPCLPIPVNTARMLWPMHENEEVTDLTLKI